jgi:hypothetical protein
MNTSFFYHVATEAAISKGWGFEEDIYEWCKGKSYLLDVVWSVPSGDVLEVDVLQASQGIITDKLYNLFKFAASAFPEDINKNAFVLSSSHSGSSDYLTVRNVLDLIAERELV